MNKEELIALSLQFSAKEKEYEEIKKTPEQDSVEYWKKRSADVETLLQHVLALADKHFNESFPSPDCDTLKEAESKSKSRRRVKSIEIGNLDSTQPRVAEATSERSHQSGKLTELQSGAKGSRTSRERSVSPNPSMSLRSSTPNAAFPNSSGASSARQRPTLQPNASAKQNKFSTVGFNDCLNDGVKSSSSKEDFDPERSTEEREEREVSQERASKSSSSKPSPKLTRSDGSEKSGEKSAIESKSTESTPPVEKASLSETQKGKERKPRDRTNLKTPPSTGTEPGADHVPILEILLPTATVVPSVQEPASSSNSNSATNSASSSTGTMPAVRTKKRSVSAAPHAGSDSDRTDKDGENNANSSHTLNAGNNTNASSSSRSERERGSSKSPERGGSSGGKTDRSEREERSSKNVRRLSEDFTKQLRMDEKGVDFKAFDPVEMVTTRVKKEVNHPSALQIFQNLEIESEIMKVKEANKVPTSARGRSRSFNDNPALISHSKPLIAKFGPDGTPVKRERPKGGLFEKPIHNTVGKNKFQKKSTQSRMNLFFLVLISRDMVRLDAELKPVVLPVESNAFLIEVPEFSSDPELSLLYIPDHYKEIFAGNKHFNWIACTEAQVISVVSLLEKCDETTKATRGLINNKKGFKLFEIPPSTDNEKGFDFTSLQHNIRAIQLEKALKAQNPKTFYSRIKGSDAEQAIANIEKQFRQEQSIFKVSIVYCKAGQVDPLQMFKNVDHSESFDQFLNIMEVSSVGTNCLDELITWKEKKVGYLLATKLNAEQHRRLIGNTQAVIFFKESSEPFNIEEVDKMGIVPQFFAVVQPANDDQYRIGFFNRIAMKIIEPKVPSNILFDKKTLKDFLLTKIHNGYMIARQVPPINRLWEQPRQVAINQIAYEYAPKQWLKKVAPQVHDEIEQREALLG